MASIAAIPVTPSANSAGQFLSVPIAGTMTDVGALLAGTATLPLVTATAATITTLNSTTVNAGTVVASTLLSLDHAVVWINGAGVPTDGTTGANVAEIGSIYSDRTAGKIYVNGGTKASPAWKIVTSA